jgi:hypothetical protein
MRTTNSTRRIDDDEDDPDLRDELAENLAAFFAGDDFEIVDLKALLAESGDDASMWLCSARTLHLRWRIPCAACASMIACPICPTWPHWAMWPQPILKSCARSGLPCRLPCAAPRWTASSPRWRRICRSTSAICCGWRWTTPTLTVRRLAVDALAQEGDPAFLGRLTQMARHDADTAVRAGAAAALGAYVLAGELDELDPALAMRAEEALMTALADGNEALEVQRRALESIAYSGEVGVRQLIEDAYYSAHEDMRLSALTAMGRSADSRWRNLVRAELGNPSAAIRAEAAFAVGELEAKAALSEIVALTGDEDATVRLAAIYALGHLGGRRSAHRAAAHQQQQRHGRSCRCRRRARGDGLLRQRRGRVFPLLRRG